MRGGINSVPVGQAEAARAIGLSFTQVLRFVILPQAFRAMVQPLVNVFIGVLLSSALAAAVGVAELTNRDPAAQPAVRRGGGLLPVRRGGLPGDRRWPPAASAAGSSERLAIKR